MTQCISKKDLCITYKVARITAKIETLSASLVLIVFRPIVFKYAKVKKLNPKPEITAKAEIISNKNASLFL